MTDETNQTEKNETEITIGWRIPMHLECGRFHTARLSCASGEIAEGLRRMQEEGL